MPSAALPLTTAELMLWSAASGGVALIALVAFFDLFISRTRASRETFICIGLGAVWIILLSGLPAVLWPGHTESLRVAQVLIGPLCAAIGTFGINGWLHARQRDRLSSLILPGMASVALMGGPLALLLDTEWELPASAALTLTCLLVALGMTIRAAQRGDRLAWGLAGATALMVPGGVGLYSIAVGMTRPGLGWQMAIVWCAVTGFVGTCLALWTRGQQLRRLANRDTTQRDPTTRLYNGATTMQKIIASQRRRRKTGSDGALMAVMVFDPGKLVPQVGHSGLQLIYTELALRMQRQTGVINPAGRYYDSCFLVVLETLHSPAWLRKMGLRVAASLRQPIEVESLTGERLIIAADIGVGLIHLSQASRNVDQLLHEALSVATAARRMSSRAGLLDPQSRKPIAAESAELDMRWNLLNAKKPASSGLNRSTRSLRSLRDARKPGETRPM